MNHFGCSDSDSVGSLEEEEEASGVFVNNGKEDIVFNTLPFILDSSSVMNYPLFTAYSGTLSLSHIIVVCD